MPFFQMMLAPYAPASMDHAKLHALPASLHLVPGLVLAGLIAAVAQQLATLSYLEAMGLNPLAIAMLGGMLVGNLLLVRASPLLDAGIDFSRQRLLRLGVILYGLRITFSQIADVGIAGILVDALVLSLTFGLAVLAGSRLFGLDRDTSMLVGAGSAICGAAAVMATEPVLRASPERVAIAVMTVVVFGTVAMFSYPVLYALNREWGLIADAPTFGLYTGATVHEVAQVIAASRSMGEEAAATALIAKMIRVMMLAPFLVALSIYVGRSQANTGERRPRVVIPWFAFAFIAMAGVHSLGWVPKQWESPLLVLDNTLLAMAMGTLGIRTQFSMLRGAGARPMGLAACLALFLVLGGWAIQHAVHLLLGSAGGAS